MAAGIDDSRIWQYQVDKADMHEIVRHLIDKARRVLAVNSCIAQVGFSHAAQLFPIQFTENFRVTRFLVHKTPAVEMMGQGDDVGQLHCAVNLRM
jgi:hypothetical protein